MLLTPIYIAMTFLKTWRIRTFRTRLLQFLGGNSSVAFYKLPEDIAETPTLSSKLCVNTKNAHLCDLYDYSSTVRICSMRPNQCIHLKDWISGSGGLPLGSLGSHNFDNAEINVLLECGMEAKCDSNDIDIIPVDSIGEVIAWKAGNHLAIVLKTNIESLSVAGSSFVTGDFIVNNRLPVVRMQTVLLDGEPFLINEQHLRSLKTDLKSKLKEKSYKFNWPPYAAELTKLSRLIEEKLETQLDVTTNGTTEALLKAPASEPNFKEDLVSNGDIKTLLTDIKPKVLLKTNLNEPKVEPKKMNGVDESIKITVNTSNNINTPTEISSNIHKRPSLKLNLTKKTTDQKPGSGINISSQLSSVTTHKRTVTTTAPKVPAPSVKSAPAIEPSAAVKMQSNNETIVTLNGSTSEATISKLNRPTLRKTKSPNVIIYSDSVATRDNLENTLRKILDCDSYTVYGVGADTLEGGAWGRAALVAVAGGVGTRAAQALLSHLLSGGRVLALCSDLLHTVLPYYKTAEVRENEVVQFSYQKWHSVRLKHHIFCYQASPAKKQFSTENDKQILPLEGSVDESNYYSRSSRYAGHLGHVLDIRILASEETWRTPSLLQATDSTSNGIAIFSQIHLEAETSEYLEAGSASDAAEQARLGILRHILGDLLGLHVREGPEDVATYTPAYFLGNHVHKNALVERVCREEGGTVMELAALTLQFCSGAQRAGVPSEHCLPVMVHQCPQHFDTLQYFQELQTEHLGRLVLYSDVLTSSQTIVNGGTFQHGFMVVPRVQTMGVGRSGNRWLSGAGCAMCSLQVNMRVATAPLAQHAAAVAAVQAVKRHCPQLEIRIKWPNDVYYKRDLKLGGTIATATCQGDEVLVNIGTGLNLDNERPTTCINSLIREQNTREQNKPAVPALTLESFLAAYCNALEQILASLDTQDGQDHFLELYYQYWLHDNEEVKLVDNSKSEPITGKVVGIDGSGFLKVLNLDSGMLEVVQPDGNTFDMMSGLIAPKTN